VFRILDELPLFEAISSQVSEFEKKKRAKSDLFWFFPKLMLSIASAGISTLAEFSYLLLNYKRTKEKLDLSRHD
jgi:hypothetical protein